MRLGEWNRFRRPPLFISGIGVEGAGRNEHVTPGTRGQGCARPVSHIDWFLHFLLTESHLPLERECLHVESPASRSIQFLSLWSAWSPSHQTSEPPGISINLLIP